ncbi:unnamed protein product [Dovyalis caffra]|uniref:Uncharacterized protein n=1 Tax=Dovyalis caffra TaxID=77055 RepID=A0AAV1S9I5_9ROSI|nr:unnamed protein product [Dovyalis caffra]
MKESNEKHDEIIFLSNLSACVHKGFVDDGLEIFSKIENYGCRQFTCRSVINSKKGAIFEKYLSKRDGDGLFYMQACYLIAAPLDRGLNRAGRQKCIEKTGKPSQTVSFFCPVCNAPLVYYTD